MRVVIIGGSGHVGTYLVPMLVERGHEVINVTRGQRQPYLPHAAWQNVKHVEADRAAEDQADTFGRRVRDLKPDAVIDMICMKESSVRQMVEALRGCVGHYLHCSTVWVFGHSTQVPATEDLPCHPFGEYGIQKAAIEALLLKEAHVNGFPATMLRAGHIVGPGYNPLNPAGNFNPQVFSQLAHGEELALPNLGMETVHHVHAADVAQGFMQALANWNTSVGEAFHIVSPAALTLRGYAEAVSSWFGQRANLKFLPWEEWHETVSETDAAATWEHISRSPNASIAKAQRLISYQPRYTSLEAIYESVQWLIEHEVVSVPTG